MRGAILGLIFAVPAMAEPVTYSFVWKGAGGYEMRGALRFEANRADWLVRETDLSCFVIEGSLEGAPVGRWALTQLEVDTTWRLHFDAEAGAFLVEGDGVWMPQAWNMDGAGMNCGADGFGFNIGNAAQDLCVDNTLIVESQVDPFRPFPALPVDSYDFPDDACYAPPLLSQAGRLGHSPS